MTLGELLKSKRWNGSSISKELGVDRATVSLWVRGKTEPKAETIKRIAELCEVKPSDVFNAVLKTKEETKEGK